MSKQTKSLVRTVLKVVGTAAVSFGVLETGQVDVIVSAAAEIGGALAVLYGVFLSWKDKTET